VAVIFSGSIAKIYVNGNLEGTNAAASKGTTTDPFYLGIEDGVYGPLNGVLDDVRIYDRELSAAEIQALASGTPTKLVITAVNSGANPTAGTAFPVVVQSQDASGTSANVTSATNVSLSLKTGTGTLGGTLTGTIAAGTSQGIISGVTYTKAESGVVITATRTSGDNLTAGDSAAFTVVPGSANKLAFSVQPGTSNAGSAISGPPTVVVQDSFNNTITSSTASIAVAIGTNPAGGILSGTTPKNATSGVAAFSDLSINQPGNGYTLTATSAGLTSATSATFNIIATTGTVGGTVVRASDSNPINGALVKALQGGVLKGSATTAANGSYSIGNLAAGSYDIRASSAGYGTQTQNGQSVTAGNTTTVNFSLVAAPNITGVSPASGVIATVVTISGTGFGATQGTSTVTFNGISATPSSWTGASIVAPVPSGASTGPLVVTVAGVASNGTTFTVQGSVSVIYVYDELGRLRAVTEPASDTAVYNYDAVGNLLSITRQSSALVSIIEFSPTSGPAGTYDASHRMLTLKDNRQIVFLTNEYDGNGRVFRQTQADTSVYQFAYTVDGSGKVTQTDVTDPRGKIRRVTMNTDGQIVTDTRALGLSEEQVTTYELQAGTNLALSVTDPLNRKTAFTYDSKGNVLSMTRLANTPDAVTTTATYEPIYNQLTSVTDPLNHTTTAAYDATGNLVSVTNALNQTTTIGRNGAGQPISITDALNNTTQFTYDFGDFAGATDPLGNASARFTDSAGRVLGVSDPLGNLSIYDYDVLNRLTKVTDPISGQTNFTYDPNGNLLSVTDARSNPTVYTYDNMDRLATRKDPLLRTETHLYDLSGNRSQFTDRKSQVATYTYDGLDRRTGVTYQKQQ